MASNGPERVLASYEYPMNPIVASTGFESMLPLRNFMAFSCIHLRAKKHPPIMVLGIGANNFNVCGVPLNHIHLLYTKIHSLVDATYSKRASP